MVKAKIGILIFVSILLIPALPTVAQNEASLSSRLLTYDRDTGVLSFAEIQTQTVEILSQTTVATYQSLNSWWVNDDTILVAVGTDPMTESDLYLATPTNIEKIDLDSLLQPDTVNFVTVVEVYDPYILFEVIGAIDRNIVLFDTTTQTASFLSGGVLAYRYSQSASYYIRSSDDGQVLRYWTDNGEIPTQFTLIEQNLETDETQVIHQIEANDAGVFFADRTGDEWLFYVPTPEESTLVLYRADGTSQDLTEIDQVEDTFVNIWGDQVLIRTDERTDQEHILRFEGLDTDFEAVLRFPVVNARPVIYHLYEDGRFLVQNFVGQEVWLAAHQTEPTFLGYSTQFSASVSRDWRLAAVESQGLRQLWDLEVERVVYETSAIDFQNIQFFEAGFLFNDRDGALHLFHYETEAVYPLPPINGHYDMILPDGSLIYSQQSDIGFDTYRYDPVENTHTLLFEGLAVYYPQHIGE